MENIEILAELKAMYHFITDITENAEEEQIADNDFEEFEKMETFLEKQYAKMYEKIEKTDKDKLRIETNVLISNVIYYDYMNNDNSYLCIDQTSQQEKWYNEIIYNIGGNKCLI